MQWIMDFFDSLLLQLASIGTGPDELSVGAVTLFVALICASIVLSRFAENTKWINESVIAILLVGFYLLELIYSFISLHVYFVVHGFLFGGLMAGFGCWRHLFAGYKRAEFEDLGV